MLWKRAVCAEKRDSNLGIDLGSPRLVFHKFEKTLQASEKPESTALRYVIKTGKHTQCSEIS